MRVSVDWRIARAAVRMEERVLRALRTPIPVTVESGMRSNRYGANLFRSAPTDQPVTGAAGNQHVEVLPHHQTHLLGADHTHL